MNEPDLQGFIDTQADFNHTMGEAVSFVAVEPKVWPPGTPLDKETGEPYDPTIKPTSGGGEITTVVVSTPIEGAIRAQDPTRISPSGVRDTEELVFIVNFDDYTLVEDAVYVDHNGERYHVTDIKNDDDRYLVYTEPT